MGFPTGQRYVGAPEQKDKLRRQYDRKSEFMRMHKTPCWNGEFGPVYANPRTDEDADAINESRYQLLGEQLRIYDKEQIPWSIWLYKDIGLQGMVHTNPDSPWNQLIQPILEKKKRLQLDAWGMYPSTEIDNLLQPLIKWIDEVSPEAKATYPTTWNTARHVERAVMQSFLAETFVVEFARLFTGKGEVELDELARSFAFENCVQREGLNRILKEHAGLEVAK